MPRSLVGDTGVRCHGHAVCLSAAAVLALLVAIRIEPTAQRANGRTSGPSSGSSYLGSESCRECHEDQYSTWKKSLHVQMTRPIADARVLGNFTPGTRLEQNRRTFRMDTRDGKFSSASRMAIGLPRHSRCTTRSVPRDSRDTSHGLPTAAFSCCPSSGGSTQVSGSTMP